MNRRTSARVNVNLICPAILGIAALFLAACSAPVIVPPVEPPPPPPAPAPVVEAPKPEPVVEAPKPEPEPLRLPGPVTFKIGSDDLTTESDATLKQVAEYLTQKAQVTLLRVEGHTDNVGGKHSNQKLSEARALSVAKWLVKSGIDCKRILPVGFGEMKPTVDNTTEEGRSQNRRTMFINAAVDGKELGGKPVDGGGAVAGDPCKR